MLIGIAAAVLLLVLAFVFVDREIYFYEGTHLSPRIQAWLYDRWAKEYDQGKQASQQRDAEVLARPLASAMRESGVTDPLVLDLATGTGRLPRALLDEPAFTGRVLALDISAGMLSQAARKLQDRAERVTLIQYARLPLPFPAETFDAVCCLEALEVMPEMQTPLAELQRVLKPGGVLLTSRGTEASGRKNKVVPAADFRALLERSGFEQVEIQPWWKLFDFVRARKPGPLASSEPRALEDVLLCPSCGKLHLASEGGALICRSCGAQLAVTSEGILQV